MKIEVNQRKIFIRLIFVPLHYTLHSGDFNLNKNPSFLGNLPLSPRLQNTNFHLEPASRKAEILYQIECDVGANKNAEQAFSMKRLSSHSI